MKTRLRRNETQNRKIENHSVGTGVDLLASEKFYTLSMMGCLASFSSLSHDTHSKSFLGSQKNFASFSVGVENSV